MAASPTDALRRLAILQHLSALPQFGANVVILQNVLTARGIPASQDEVHEDLLWLDNLALVKVTHGDGFVLGTLTRLGGQVASGERQIDGIARPGPGA